MFQTVRTVFTSLDATGSNGPLTLNDRTSSFYVNEHQGDGLFTHKTVTENNLGGIRGDDPANILPTYSSYGAYGASE
ncbi:hypothetical protein GUITHDRAFT_111862 [Guillardia theta CCMP2712]|uniref:Uncharacterized protein n=1 Tax=Guillardia theta (strain CCMP2712) TaxID=905079 RepID=L1J0E8_GUITC|nr:hypothetical protein GUITHDRAFT_111862 [Guillardia theta CCMP2712]EKX42008.1 hypothetical protein GUITHDRAFT_111862 [Guillardia theta CCMP2712]|eukprot:XP_005828988.1 hypothetical protein GUITHDRAFT_111862 [Guillardia theta CCMP2712]